MCGIAGAFDLTGERAFSRVASPGHDVGHPRTVGPDDEQAHHEPGVALGARRLAILDLAGGRQPIANEDGSVWVAFNGELVRIPPSSAVTWSTRPSPSRPVCDTEAWVHLYEDRGEAMFEKARGQFAVSLWDRTNRTLILGREPRRHLARSTTPSATAGSCGVQRSRRSWPRAWSAGRPDVKGVDHIFSFFCAGTSRTFSRGSNRCRPAIICGSRMVASSSRNTGISIFPMPAMSAGSTM